MGQTDLFEKIIVDNFAGGGGASTGIEQSALARKPGNWGYIAGVLETCSLRGGRNGRTGQALGQKPARQGRMKMANSGKLQALPDKERERAEKKGNVK